MTIIKVGSNLLSPLNQRFSLTIKTSHTNKVITFEQHHYNENCKKATK